MNYKQKNNKNKYSDVWITPEHIYKSLDYEFDFDLDAATEPNNPLKTRKFYTAADDSLTKQGDGNVFLNPPYSNIADGVLKARKEGERERERVVVLLIPARTDTRYFHEHIAPFCEVRFIKGRLKFSSKGSAPFPSMVCIYGKAPNIKTQ